MRSFQCLLAQELRGPDAWRTACAFGITNHFFSFCKSRRNTPKSRYILIGKFLCTRDTYTVCLRTCTVLDFHSYCRLAVLDALRYRCFHTSRKTSVCTSRSYYRHIDATMELELCDKEDPRRQGQGGCFPLSCMHAYMDVSYPCLMCMTRHTLRLDNSQ